MELRPTTPVFQVRYSPLIKVKSALEMVSSKYQVDLKDDLIGEALMSLQKVSQK